MCVCVCVLCYSAMSTTWKIRRWLQVGQEKDFSRYIKYLNEFVKKIIVDREKSMAKMGVYYVIIINYYYYYYYYYYDY